MPFLTISDTSRLEGAYSSCHTALWAGGGWGKVVCRDTAGFDVANVVKQLDKTRVKGLLAKLRMAAPASGFQVPFSGPQDAHELAMLIDRLNQRAAFHQISGGAAAKVLVGSFRFSETMEGVIDSNSIPVTTTLKWRSGPHEEFFEVPLHLTLVITHATSFCLLVKAEIDIDHLGVEQKHGCAARGMEKIAVDVYTASNQALLLRMHDAVVSSDGFRAEAGASLCVLNESGHSLIKALIEGITCVVYVRDGSEPGRCSDRTVEALDLE